MATQIVKRRNFKAPLPDDFCVLKSVYRLKYFKINEPVACKQFPTPNDDYCEYFTIGKDHFFFSGYWSPHPIKRWFQKIKERIWPVKYKVEYISITEANPK